MKNLRVAVIDVFGTRYEIPGNFGQQLQQNIVRIPAGAFIFVISKHDEVFTKVLCSSGILLMVHEVIENNTAEY